MGVDDPELAARIHDALVTGDNRLKQGVELAKVRESYERALELAREGGVEERVRQLVEVRLADLDRLAAELPPPARPEAGRRASRLRLSRPRSDSGTLSPHRAP